MPSHVGGDGGAGACPPSASPAWVPEPTGSSARSMSRAILPRRYVTCVRRCAPTVLPLTPATLHSSGCSISSGRTSASNSSGVRKPSATVASLSVVPSLCAFFAHLATSVSLSTSATRHRLARCRPHAAQQRSFQRRRTVVAETLVQDSRKHQGLVEQGGNASLVSLNTNNTVVGERPRSCIRPCEIEPQRRLFGLPSASKRIDCRTFLIMTGLKTFSCAGRRCQQMRWSSERNQPRTGRSHQQR